MGIIEILVYLTGTIFFLTVLIFTYYVVINARLMRGPLRYRLIVFGAIGFVIASIVTVVSIFFFPHTAYLQYGLVAIWMIGFLLIVAGGFLRGRVFRKIHGISLFKFPYVSYYLMMGALVISVPLYLLDLLAPGLSWYNVGSISIWILALGSLAMGERSIHLATRLLVAVAPGKEISLLRYDITAVRAYCDLINTFLKAVKPAAGLIKETQLEYFEYNPILFEGCKLRQDGTIDVESIKGNIDRIHDENRIQEICSVFSVLLSRLLEFISTIISPKYSEEVLHKSYKAIRKVYGDSPLFFDILRSLPKGVLEEERIALLPRDELEARVRERTRELEESRSYTDNIIKSMMSMLIVVDLDGNIRTINKTTEKRLGYDEKELIGQPVDVVFAEGSLGIEDLIKKRYVRNLDKNYLAKDSRKIPILFSGSVMYDVDDKVQGAVYLAQDITDLKHAEEESHKIHMSLVEAHKKLQRAYEEEKQLRDKLIQSEKLASLGQMGAKIAHEINNPLAIISGMAQLSKRKSREFS